MQTPAERIDDIIRAVCEAHELPTRVVLGRAKDQMALAARRAVVDALYAEGLTSKQIGDKINRDHTSVLNLMGRLKRNKEKRSVAKSV